MIKKFVVLLKNLNLGVSQVPIVYKIAYVAVDEQKYRIVSVGNQNEVFVFWRRGGLAIKPIDVPNLHGVLRWCLVHLSLFILQKLLSIWK